MFVADIMGAAAATFGPRARIVECSFFFFLFNSGVDDPSPPAMASSSDSSFSGSDSTHVHMWVTETPKKNKKLLGPSEPV
jgi:hypothetical protein